MPARRVSTPGEAPASRPWGQDQEAPGTSLQQQKKLLKTLAVSADVSRPAAEGWGQRRTPDTYEQRAGYGRRGKRRSSSASREAQPRQRGEQQCGRGAPELGDKRCRREGTRSAGRSGKQSGGTVPAQPPLPSFGTQGSAPRQRHLLTTGRGTSKPGHFNIGAARETEGRLEHAGTLDGNRRLWLRRGFKATRRWPPGPRARWPPPHAAPAGRGNRRKKKRKEEKWCLLSRWCCEEGKEGHGQPGAVGVQRPGTAGAAEGRGRLPSPPCRPSPLSQRRESAAGALACGSRSGITP